MREYLTPREAGERLGVGTQTIYRYIKEGRLEAVRLAGGPTLRIPIKAVSDMLTDVDGSAKL